MIVKTVSFSSIGFLFGFVLLGLSILAAGGGHGTPLLLGLSSSPLHGLAYGLAYALPTNSLAAIPFLFTPVLWGLLWYLAALLPKRPALQAFVALIGIHYAAALPVLISCDWNDVSKVQEVFSWGVGIYVVGQIALWIMFLRKVPLVQIVRCLAVNTDGP